MSDWAIFVMSLVGLLAFLLGMFTQALYTASRFRSAATRVVPLLPPCQTLMAQGIDDRPDVRCVRPFGHPGDHGATLRDLEDAGWGKAPF